MNEEAKKLLAYAYNLSLYYGYEEVCPRFLFFAALGCPNEIIQRGYRKLKLGYDDFVTLESKISYNEKVEVGKARASKDLKAILKRLDTVKAENPEDTPGNAVDLLMCAIFSKKASWMDVFPALGVSKDKLATELEYQMLAERQREEEAAKQENIEKYCKELSKMAMHGELDPVIGRKDEMQRLIQILGRRRKNNPVIVGEAGVGKTAIVEGLALKIHNKDPDVAPLHDKRLVVLDLHLMLAGTQYRGQFEERLTGLIKELEEDPNTIAFIDEVHNISGAGKTEGGANDAANILKPAMARGKIQIIGATTKKEYHFIKRDPALERRFQPVELKKLTESEIYAILKGVKGNYEKFHDCKYTAGALKACIEFGKQIEGRNSPDIEIDLLDEVGSRHKGEKIGRAQVKEIFKLQQDADQNKKKKTMGFGG